MLNTIRAIVRDGKIELLEPVKLLDGAQILVTVLAEDDQAFWQNASTLVLDKVWDNSEDDVYAELFTS